MRCEGRGSGSGKAWGVEVGSETNVEDPEKGQIKNNFPRGSCPASEHPISYRKRSNGTVLDLG